MSSQANRRRRAALEEPALSRAARRAGGVFYTPPEIVQRIVELTLEPLLAARSATPLTILDPACGAGEFLIAAYRAVARRQGAAAARGAIRGWDIDGEAVARARQRLASLDGRFDARQVQVRDALEGEAEPAAAVDAIVGNPPYVNIRQLALAHSPLEIADLRRRFRTARGHFDLFVLFVERAWQLLRPGGRCGLLLPHRWATADYARPCRELLLTESALEQIVDLSAEKIFCQAKVYPQVVVFRKQRPAAGHVVQPGGPLAERSDALPAVPQHGLAAEAISMSPPLAVEARVGTAPLGAVARLACGTTGYAASRVAGQLVEADNPDAPPPEGWAEFLTSGNIDRYRVTLGDVRYLGRTYARPRLPLAAPAVSAFKRQLFGSPKIVVAGLSRRLEAAWADRPLALGVQVFAAYACQLDPFYLLALLNSKLLAYLYATRYSTKRLSDGYLAVHKGQLAHLPIAVEQPSAYAALGPAPRGRPPRSRGPRQRAISRLGRSLMQAGLDAATDARLDAAVYALYGLDDAEIERIEAHFAALPRQAA